MPHIFHVLAEHALENVMAVAIAPCARENNYGEAHLRLMETTTVEIIGPSLERKSRRGT